MAQFRFRLQALQQYREHQRDLCRQLLAEALHEESELLRRRDLLTREREQILTEMGALELERRVNVDQAAARRYHAAQLQADVRQIDADRQRLAQRIQLCRQALSKADQGVKVLEKLAEKQKLEFLQGVEKAESREREEGWQSGRIGWTRDLS